MVLTHKFCDGVVPSNEDKVDYNIINEVDEAIKNVDALVEKFSFREALTETINIARTGNKYLQDTAPWHAIKEEGGQQRVEEILNVSLQLVARFAHVCNAFLPNTSDKIKAMLRLGGGELVAGNPVEKPSLLFEKIEDEQIQKQLDKLTAQASANEGAGEKLEPIKPTITFDDFSKLDLRVGTIVEAQKVKKADKLLQLFVDIGLEKRTILSGIAQHFSPEDLIGKQAVVVTNLAPRKMRGVESNGMLLMAENAEGELVFVSPEKDFLPGAIVR
jgi:methionyl-tRNA synthetase